MSVDLATTIIAKSDQLNADDLLSGPLTGKVTHISKGSTAEQPISITLDCWPQPFKPCKTMRRVLVAAWGTKGDDYVGRSMTLFRDPNVKWAGEPVGGIRISALSHMAGPLEISLAESRKSKKKLVIGVLQTSQPQPSPMEAMKARWKEAATDKTADGFRVFVSEATAGQIGMADAMKPDKYTPELLARCEAAIERLAHG